MADSNPYSAPNAQVALARASSKTVVKRFSLLRIGRAVFFGTLGGGIGGVLGGALIGAAGAVIDKGFSGQQIGAGALFLGFLQGIVGLAHGWIPGLFVGIIIQFFKVSRLLTYLIVLSVGGVIGCVEYWWYIRSSENYGVLPSLVLATSSLTAAFFACYACIGRRKGGSTH